MALNCNDIWKLFVVIWEYTFLLPSNMCLFRYCISISVYDDFNKYIGIVASVGNKSFVTLNKVVYK